MEMTGNVLRIENKKAYIFTSDARIVAIQARKGQYVGEQITFKEAEIIPPKRYSADTILKGILAVAASIALVLIGIYAGLHINGKGNIADTKCALVMSVDINPGIQLLVNEKAKVIEAVAMNDDGAMVLDSLSLSGETIKQAVRDILDRAEVLGYINSETNLIMVTGVVNDVTMDNMDEYTKQLRTMLATLEQEYGSNLFTILSTDSEIITRAAEDNLSVGKEMFYYYAAQVGSGLTVDEISSSSITDIVAKLNAADSSGSIDASVINALEGNLAQQADAQLTVTPLPNDAAAAENSATITPTEIPVITEAVVTPTEEPAISQAASAAPTAEPTAAPTAAPTATPTAEPTKPVQDSISPKLTVGTQGEALTFSWTGFNGSSVVYNGKTYSGFNFYKVVASKTNPNPVYPDDGYLTYISSKSETSWTVTPATDSYGSPDLVPGETYYFSITYVFDNGKFTSNTVQKTVPEDLSDDTDSEDESEYEDESGESNDDTNDDSYEEDAEDSYSSAASIDPIVQVEVEDGKIKFEWSSLEGSSCKYNGVLYTNFYYYKVVIDEYDSTPIYPDNGYLYYSTDTGTDSYETSLSDAGLQSGHSYYMTITYVFESGKFTSNVLYVAIP